MPALHPTEETLHEYVLGKLSDPVCSTVTDHIAECPECLSLAASARPADALVELLAAAGLKAGMSAVSAATPMPNVTPSLGAPTREWEYPASGAELFVPPDLANHPRYRILRLLGYGGMGTVWLAEHTVMKKQVALKVIRREFLAKSGAAERFRREVQAVARLNDPNIVAAHDAERAGGTHFLVMEYVAGETLAERVARGPLPVAEACRAARDAARGLAHAHAAGLVHRDIKPHNLIRAADGTVKVLDFGLAGAFDSAEHLTGTNVVMGTPDYIAPEQAEDPRTADPRSDVYSLGCTLHHLLAGVPPFGGTGPIQKIDAHRTRAADPIPHLPPALAAVLAKMMAKNPTDRFQSAAEVAEALEPFTVRTGDDTPKPAPPKKPWKRWLVAAGLLLALGGAAAAVVQHRIKTDTGEVVIETTDNDVEVVVKQGGQIVTIYDPKTNQKLVLKSGTYEFELNGKATGLKLDLDKATLKRGDVVVAKITHVPPVSEQPQPADTPFAPAPDKPGVVQRLKFSGGYVKSVEVAPDGRTFVVGRSSPEFVHVYETATGRLLYTFSGWGGIYADGGRKVVTRSGSRFEVYDLMTGKHERSFGQFGPGPFAIWDFFTIGEQRTRLLVTGADKTFRLFNVTTGEQLLTTVYATAPVYTHTPDGTRVLIKANGEASYKAYDTETGKLVGDLDVVCKLPALEVFSAQAQTVLSYNGKAHDIRRASDGVILGEYRRPRAGQVHVGYTHDRTRAVLYGPEKQLIMFDSAVGLTDTPLNSIEVDFPGNRSHVLTVRCDTTFVPLATWDGHVAIVRLPEIGAKVGVAVPDAKPVDLRGPGPKVGQVVRDEMTLKMTDGTFSVTAGGVTETGKMTMTGDGVYEEAVLAVGGGEITKSRTKVVREKITESITFEGETDTHDDTSSLEGETVEFEKAGAEWKRSLVGKVPTDEQKRDLTFFPPPLPAAEFYPAEPVKPGHSWNPDVTKLTRHLGLPMPVQIEGGTWKMTFVRVTTVNGEECAEIAEEVDVRAKVKGEKDAGTIAVKARGTTYRSLKTSVCVESRFAGTMSATETQTVEGQAVRIAIGGSIEVHFKSRLK